MTVLRGWHEPPRRKTGRWERLFRGLRPYSDDFVAVLLLSEDVVVEELSLLPSDLPSDLPSGLVSALASDLFSDLPSELPGPLFLST
jgi:hypothetical protein